MRTIISKILICTAVLIFSTSCGDEWLNLYPSTSMVTDKAIVTLEDAKMAMSGVYISHRFTSTTVMEVGELIGDDMQIFGTSTTGSGPLYQWNFTTRDVPSGIWSSAYTMIRDANNLLAAIDKIDITSSAERERNYIKGEALMARARAHFDLTRTYGFPYMKDNGASWGAVIVTTPLPREAEPARNTVAECYDNLIIPDLVEAIKLMDMEGRTRTAMQGRFNKWAAKLLLSRVYLYKGDWEKALREAEECIAGAEAFGCSLYTRDNYVDGWKSKHASESIFEIVNIQNQSGSSIASQYASFTSSSSHSIGLTKPFYDHLATDSDDVRLNLLKRAHNNHPYFTEVPWPAFLEKYNNSGVTPNPNTSLANIVLYRLSEAYLNAAEAAARLGNQNDKALDYLNVIVGRANPANNITGTVTWEMVIEERRKELFGEGHRFFDLMRNGLTSYRATDNFDQRPILAETAKVINWETPRCVMLLPVQETEVNKNIQPNIWNY